MPLIQMVTGDVQNVFYHDRIAYNMFKLTAYM